MYFFTLAKGNSQTFSFALQPSHSLIPWVLVAIQGAPGRRCCQGHPREPSCLRRSGVRGPTCRLSPLSKYCFFLHVKAVVKQKMPLLISKTQGKNASQQCTVRVFHHPDRELIRPMGATQRARSSDSSTQGLTWTEAPPAKGVRVENSAGSGFENTIPAIKCTKDSLRVGTTTTKKENTTRTNKN